MSDPEILASQQNDASFEDVWEELDWRGLVHVSTDQAALKELLAGEPITYYCGFDPTAPSLHLGNLVQILTMRRLQLAGLPARQGPGHFGALRLGEFRQHPGLLLSLGPRHRA